MERGRLIVQDDVSAALGKSKEEIAAMKLGQFCELAYYHGLDVRVSGFDVSGDGGLTVKMDAEARPIVHVGED